MALRFAGGADYAYSSVAFTSNAAHSVVVRAYVSTDSPSDFVYGDVSSGGDFANALWIGQDTGPVWKWRESAGGGEIYEYNQALSLDTWTHLAITYDGTTFRSYVDGVEVDAATGSLGSRAAFDWFDTGYGSDFRLQDVAVFNRELSPAEVAGLAAYRTTDALDTGVYLWVPMFSGSEYTDQSGNGHDLASGASGVADDPAIPLAPPSGMAGRRGWTRRNLGICGRRMVAR